MATYMLCCTCRVYTCAYVVLSGLCTHTLDWSLGPHFGNSRQLYKFMLLVFVCSSLGSSFD